MAVKLLRESSETPNITNKDDAKMVRYAYGGYTGYVKNCESELNHTMDGSIFKLQSGRFVVNGWEVAVENNTYQLNLSNVSGTVYYSVYAELNIATETVQIKSTYLTSDYPEIDTGDDLTQYPGGTSRVLLYHIKSVNKTASEVIKKIKPIPYLTEIEERLEKLGFKQGELEIDNTGVVTVISSPTVNIIKRQGNYIVGELRAYFSYPIGGGDGASIPIAHIPEGFRPKEDTIVSNVDAIAVDVLGRFVLYQHIVKITTDGTLCVVIESDSGLWTSTGMMSHVTFGYEANPL